MAVEAAVAVAAVVAVVVVDHIPHNWPQLKLACCALVLELPGVSQW